MLTQFTGKKYKQTNNIVSQFTEYLIFDVKSSCSY